MSDLPSAPQKYLFLLDYDGTLTDFKTDPNRSFLPPASRRFLKKLGKKHPVILVTGRYLDRLYEISGLAPFPAVGTHGFETRYLPKELRFTTPTQRKRYHHEAAAIWKTVRSLHSLFPGIHIEKKPYSSTLHYRGISLSPQRIARLEKEYVRRCRQVITNNLWTIEKGKKMVEVHPKGFSKGKAVQALLEHYSDHWPLYAGDDLADIPALRAVRKRGLALAVGPRIPARDCDLRFRSPAQLMSWLRRQKLFR